MRVYSRGDSHLLCGHWNGSPLEIGLTGRLTALPQGETYHAHPFREYFVVLEGRGAVLVDGRRVDVEAESAVMIEAEEPHRWLWIDPDAGIRWVLVKESSGPHAKTVVPEPDLT
jgi:quercetin dioxygenase-like cupin family protein